MPVTRLPLWLLLGLIAANLAVGGYVLWLQSAIEARGCEERALTPERWEAQLRSDCSERLTRFAEQHGVGEEERALLDVVVQVELDRIVAMREATDSCFASLQHIRVGLAARDEPSALLGPLLAARFWPEVLGVDPEVGPLPVKTVHATEVDRQNRSAHWVPDPPAGDPELLVHAQGLLEWLPLPAGSFSMGRDEIALPDRPRGEHRVEHVRHLVSLQQPGHEVELPGFELLRSEVTVAQYRLCVEAGVCAEPWSSGDYANWGREGREGHPVNKVDWYQASTFCAWVGGRLPTEAEWEYAARSAGKDYEYPWGNQPATCDHAIFRDGRSGCGADRTWEVCSRPVGISEQGLCDMAGNLGEWTQDGWSPGFEGAPSDGSAWEPPGAFKRVLRGGAFGASELIHTSRYRSGRQASYPCWGIGFRCAR